MIKAIIFDVGGVIKKGDVEIEIRRDISLTTGLNIKIVEKIYNKHIKDLCKGKTNYKEFWINFAKDGKISIPKNGKELLTKAHEKRDTNVKSIHQLAKKLRENGYITPILSNSIKLHTIYNKKIGTYTDFFPIILSEEVGMKKPNKNIYKYTSKILKLKPAECIFIDDREENILGAKSIGMNGIVYKNINQLKEELKKLKIDL